MSFNSTLMEYAAKEWIKSFQKAPFATSVITLCLITTLGFGTYQLHKVDKEKREISRLKSLEYETQITQLDNTEKNIKQLLEFIYHQKKNLRNTQDSINELKQEREMLQPLVESERQLVNAIFKAQEERNNENVWRERWLGFGFGILASLIASFIWFVVKMGLSIVSKKRF